VGPGEYSHIMVLLVCKGHTRVDGAVPLTRMVHSSEVPVAGLFF